MHHYRSNYMQQLSVWVRSTSSPQCSVTGVERFAFPAHSGPSSRRKVLQASIPYPSLRPHLANQPRHDTGRSYRLVTFRHLRDRNQEYVRVDFRWRDPSPLDAGHASPQITVSEPPAPELPSRKSRPKPAWHQVGPTGKPRRFRRLSRTKNRNAP